MPTPQKEQKVQELEEALQQATSAVFVDYRGLTTKEMEDLRHRLRERGARLQVVKNTLFRLALDRCGVTDLDEALVGPTAVAFGYDEPSAPAKVLEDFAKTHEACGIKPIGLVGTRAASFTEIAKLPSRNDLLGQLVGFLNAPLATVTEVLTALGRTPLTTILGLGQSPVRTILGLQALKEQEAT